MCLTYVCLFLLLLVGIRFIKAHAGYSCGCSLLLPAPSPASAVMLILHASGVPWSKTRRWY